MLQALDAEMRARADADRGVVERAGLGLGGGDQIRNGLKTLRRRDDQNIGHADERADCRKVIGRVIRQAWVKCRRDGVLCERFP